MGEGAIGFVCQSSENFEIWILTGFLGFGFGIVSSGFVHELIFIPRPHRLFLIFTVQELWPQIVNLQPLPTKAYS